MDIVKFEFLKLLKKSRGWLGPILVFILIMIAYPLTVEVSDVELSQSFFSILWNAALLVMMLATEDIFLEDQKAIVTSKNILKNQTSYIDNQIGYHQIKNPNNYFCYSLHLYPPSEINK